MKGLLIALGAWGVAAAAAVRFTSSKWHPDKGRSIDEALAPYMTREDWIKAEERMTERRTDENTRTT